MSSQSPKANRPHAPGENPPSDNLPENKQGGTHPERHTSGSGSPSVPSGLHTNNDAGGFGGNVAARDEHVSSGPSTPSQAGGPGFAKSKDAQRKGGNVHQT